MRWLKVHWHSLKHVVRFRGNHRVCYIKDGALKPKRYFCECGYLAGPDDLELLRFMFSE